jgi:hypothetical protein
MKNMKRTFLMVSIIAFLASCNNSSNPGDNSQQRDPISEENRDPKQNSDFDIMCDCYKNIEESYEELFEMSDEERERNEYKWNKIKGKSRDIDCITANENEMRRLEKENPEIKNWDELLEIWSENCPSAKKAEMMRKKLSGFYENR